MKITELNREQFSLKNIVIQFSELQPQEAQDLMNKLQRIANKIQLNAQTLIAIFDIDELTLFGKNLSEKAQIQTIEQINQRHQLIWSGKNFQFDLTREPIIYSIVNVTPDSFYDGATKNLEMVHILKRVETDLEKGAAVLELGGKSSRPGYSDISPEEEWKRLEKPLREIRKTFPQAVLAVDTDEAFVMERALEVGVDIINDIDGFDTKEKLKIVKQYQPAVVAMNNGRTGFHYADNVFEELPEFFMRKHEELIDTGLKREQICIDPGVGFFKGPSGQDSLNRIKTTEILTRLELPVMIAISRKSFMGNIFGVDVDERLFSTLMLEAQMVLDGGRILRVHDVKETKHLLDAIKIYKNN